MTDADLRHAPRTPRASAGLAVAGALASAVAFVGVYLVMVGTGLGQRVDHRMMNLFADALPSRWAETLLNAVSATSMLVATALVVAVTAAFRGRRPALVATAAAASVFVIAQVLKMMLPRPDLLGWSPGNSFPSGHVAAVAGLTVAVVVAVPRVARWPIALLVATPAIAITGLATVVNEWHRPSDVIGSALIALGVAAVATYAADGSRLRDAAHPAAPQPSPSRVP